VLFYAPESDSVLWEYYLEPTGLYGILAADITRDSVVDIVVGRYNQGSEFSDSAVIIDVFDGADNWTTRTRYYHPTVKYSQYWGPYYAYESYGGFTIFYAYDVNGDGFNEFFVSYGNRVLEVSEAYMETMETTNGRTWMYYEYPDSMQWKFYMMCNSVIPINPGHSNMLAANSCYYNSHTGHGPDYLYSKGDLRAFDQFGTRKILAYPLETTDYGKAVVYDEYIASQIDLMASGFIDSNNDNSDLLVRYGWEAYSYITRSSNSGCDLRLYTLVSPDSCVLSWAKPCENVKTYVCLHDFPGVYFGFGNDSLKMFSGDNGEFLDGTPAKPDIFAKWLTMPDNSVRLISVSGNVIKTQRVERATAAGDDPVTALPAILSLGQPYPNPFNGAQTIPVTVQPGHHLTVTVYDILGRKVVDIFDGVVHTGTTKLSWKAANLPSGVYFVRAISKNQSATVRSILLK